MLQYIRKFSGSWVSKALLTLLIGSFAIWGITDFIRPRFKSEHVAVVKKEAITRAEFYRVYRNMFNKLRGEFGDKIEKDPQVQMVLAAQVLTNLIQDSLLRQEEKKLDMVISEETLREIIQEEDAFKDKKGHFSKEKYEEFLHNRGVTEAVYLSLITNDLKRTLLMQAVTRSVGVPMAIMKPLEEQLTQTREVIFVPITAAAIPVPGAPSEEDLIDFYSKNKQLFSLPETRTLSSIILDPSAYESKVKETYPDANAQELKQAMVEYVYEIQKEIQDGIASGETLSEVASQRGLSFGTIKDVTITGQNLAGESLIGKGHKTFFTDNMIQKGFALEEGGESELIERQDGTYSIVVVDSISPESTPPFGEVKERVIALYKDKIRAVLAFDRAKEIVDQVRKGVPLEKLLKQYNLKGEILKNITLLDPVKTMSEGLFFKLFSLAPGGIEAMPTKEGAQIGQVLRIMPQGIQKGDARVRKRMEEMQKNFENDMGNHFIKSLEQEFPVEINAKAVQEMVLES